MSVHSNLCQENVYFNVYFKRKFLWAYTPNAENLYKGAAWNSSKRDKGFWKVFAVFLFFFQITFDLLLTNTSRLETLKYTDQPIWLWFLLMISIAPNRPQIQIWYGILTWIYLLTAIDLNMLARICRQQCILLFLLPLGSFSQSLCAFIIDTFLYRNRSYRRRAPSYRRHPVKLPSSVIWDKFAYRRLAANLSGIIVQKREQIRVCRFGAKCTMPPCFSVINLREIGGRKEVRAGKNFSKRAAASAPSWRR